MKKHAKKPTRKKTDSHFKGTTTPPMLLRVYSFYNMLKLGLLVWLLYRLAGDTQTTIKNTYSSKDQCNKCLNIALTAYSDKQQSYLYEFGRCETDYFSDSAVVPKPTMDKFKTVKDSTLLLNTGPPFKRSMVYSYMYMAYAVIAIAGLGGLGLLKSVISHGSSADFEDQSDLFIFNILVCSLSSVISMFFVTTIYGLQKYKDCYATVSPYPLPTINMFAAGVLVLFGLFWYISSRSRWANLAAVCAGVPLITYMCFELYLSIMIYIRSQEWDKANWIPLAICCYMFFAVFELPFIYSCTRSSCYARNHDEHSKKALVSERQTDYDDDL